MTFDDLLGGAEPTPSRSKLSANKEAISKGVSIPWLGVHFNKTRKAVMEALRDCEPIGNGKGGGAVYDLAEAASYLVTPRRELRDLIRSLTAKDLPQELRETYWNAKIKEAKYRAMAGELWPTNAVLHKLGETFKTIKHTTQLWVETIDESKGLSNEQRMLLRELVDQLMKELHEALVANAQNSTTESFVAELDEDDS